MRLPRRKNPVELALETNEIKLGSLVDANTKLAVARKTARWHLAFKVVFPVSLAAAVFAACRSLGYNPWLAMIPLVSLLGDIWKDPEPEQKAFDCRIQVGLGADGLSIRYLSNQGDEEYTATVRYGKIDAVERTATGLLVRYTARGEKQLLVPDEMFSTSSEKDLFFAELNRRRIDP